MVHTTGGSEKTDGGKRPRARSGGGRGQGQSLWIDLCVPTFPLPRPLFILPRVAARRARRVVWGSSLSIERAGSCKAVQLSSDCKRLELCVSL